MGVFAWLKTIQSHGIFNFDHAVEVMRELDGKGAIWGVKIPVGIVGGKEQSVGLAVMGEELVDAPTG